MDINTNVRTLSPVAPEYPQQRQPVVAVKESVEPAVTKQPKSGQELDQAVQAINQYVQNVQRDLQFSVDEDSGRNVVKVIDSQSKEVIRQIPSEEVLVLARQWAQQHGDETGFNLLKTTA
ncbi:MAG: flagellar protein FlaG [Gammaproteobacteria bacterium]